MTTPALDLQIDRFVLGPFETNCYLVRIETEAWVVDAGFDPDSLCDAIRALDAPPSRIILTHAHADHIAGLDEVRALCPRATVHIQPLEQRWLNDPHLNLSAGFGLPVSVAPATDALQDGQTLELGPFAWRILHTPGHSPGGVTLYQPDSGVAIVGDTLFAGSIGRFDFPTSSEQDLFRSIRETLYALPDDTRVLPGHGPETTIGREKRSNPYVRA
jgi:glyoxylase-like metal-dependent hydrolase (beta-lactamase superfamily II)